MRVGKLDPRPLLRRTGIDRAVSFGILTKCWQVPSGVITLLLIALLFDPKTQGIYYTVSAIIGLQNMAEAGLTSILMHAVSHEWSAVRIGDRGELVGDERAIGRTAALTRGGLKCLIGCSGLFVLVALIWGFALFHDSAGLMVATVLTMSVLLSAASIVLGGLVAVLEGCNQVAQVNRNRLGQAICGSLTVWAVIAAGGTLWAIPASLATQLLWESSLLAVRYRRLMSGILKAKPSGLSWRQEVWPLQWKIGLQVFVHQLAFAPMIPVLYSWHGAVVAGQAGMTLATLTQLLGISSMWIRTRAPEFGERIAQFDFASLEVLFRRTVWQSTIALVVVVVAFCGGLLALNQIGLPLTDKLSSRFLPTGLAVWIAAAMIPLHLLQCLAIYLRAHKVDPVWRITIISNLLLTAAVVIGGAQYGAIALGISMTMIYGGVTLPSVFVAWSNFKRDRAAV